MEKGPAKKLETKTLEPNSGSPKHRPSIAAITSHSMTVDHSLENVAEPAVSSSAATSASANFNISVQAVIIFCFLKF